jgi:hypothetical protein
MADLLYLGKPTAVFSVHEPENMKATALKRFPKQETALQHTGI